MRKLSFVLIVMFGLSARGECFSLNPLKLFGLLGGKTEIKTTVQKDSINKEMSDNKLELATLKNSILDLKEAIKVTANSNIELKNQLQMKNEMIANLKAEVKMKNVAYDKSVNETRTLKAERDIITNQVNDTKLMLAIFKGLLSTLGAVIIALIAAIKFVYSGMLKRLREKDNYNLKLEKKRHEYRALYLEKISPADAKRKQEYEAEISKKN